jgi:hypothetical protein
MLAPGDSLLFLEDDQSRFDLHLGEGPFRFLDQMYRAKLPRHVARALRRTNKTRGRSKNGTRYNIPWTMQSGWPDTSIGDSLVNAAMKYEIHGESKLWMSLICGDDSVTITSKRQFDALIQERSLEQRYADFGMEIEAKTSNHPLGVEFCSGRFFPTHGTYTLVPKTGKLLAKLGWDSVDRSPKNQLAWLRGISSTCRHLGNIDPIMKRLAVRLDQLTGNGKVISERVNEYKHAYSGHISSTADIHDYYFYHYGLLGEDIESICEAVDKLTLGGNLSHTFILEIAAHDC